MNKANLRRFDLLLFGITLLLVATGIVMIYSTYEAAGGDQGGHLENLVFRQSLFAAVGLVVYLVMAVVDYRILVSMALWAYMLVLTVLAVTLALGYVSFGAQSWLDLQTFFDIQPSELSKVLMVLVLARYLGKDRQALESPRPFLASAALLLPPVALIYLQPDFGTALILVTIWAGMAFLAGVRWRHMLLVGSMVLLLLPIAWFQMEDYMRSRVVGFFVPNQDPSGASYNITQALISIGSGGRWGKGLFRGTQSQLYFLRVRHTDFIFSVLAEELGFVGSLILILLFAALVFRLLTIAFSARDGYGRLLVAGVATMIMVQTMINVGMNANLLPVTGLPLPLISYGGSSLVTTLMALGLAQSVAMRRASYDTMILDAAG